MTCPYINFLALFERSLRSLLSVKTSTMNGALSLATYSTAYCNRFPNMNKKTGWVLGESYSKPDNDYTSKSCMDG